MRKIFLCTSIFLYMTNFFYTRIRTLLFTSHGLYTNPIYIQRSFSFFPQRTPMAHTKVSLYTFVAHTHKNSFPRIIYTQRPSIHIFLLYTCIDKNFFSFLYEHGFYSQRFSLLLGFLVHFIFRTTFLNEKLYTVLEFQQTLLITMKQVPT